MSIVGIYTKIVKRFWVTVPKLTMLELADGAFNSLGESKLSTRQVLSFTAVRNAQKIATSKY